MRAARPSTDRSWASRTTGTMSPPSPSETAMPRWTASWRVSVSPSSVALRSGKARRVSTVARATMGRKVTPSRRRSASARVMSASTIVVQVAAVRSDSTMARPIDARMRDSGRRR